MKYFCAGIAFLSIALACNSLGSINEYLLNLDQGKLMAIKPELDKPLSLCKDTKCYVYPDEDLRAIKKYIISLEERVKRCEEKNGAP